MGDTDAPSAPALYTPAFLALCVVCFLGFSQSFVLQPIIPLLVLDRGGDAALVGVALGVFSIPSIVLRPIVGRLADRWGTDRIMLIGTAGKALAAVLYLVPSLPFLIAVRGFHGVVWSGFTTGSTSTLARIAPPKRRLEASSAFDLMPSLGALVMPAVALVLLQATGFTGPLLLAAGLGATAALVTLVAFKPWRTRPGGEGRRQSSGGAWLEPSAVLPMVLILLFTSAASLFLVYPPLLALERGIPVTDLVLYYPVYGVVLAVSRASSGRLFEQTARGPLLAVSAVVAGVGLVVGAFATTLVVMTLAAAIFAVAYGVAPPTAQAVVMERAPRQRVGAAMATYTLGFQMGSGLGAAVWGFLVGPLGFTNVFLAAAVIQVVLFVVALARRRDFELEPAAAGSAAGTAGGG